MISRRIVMTTEEPSDPMKQSDIDKWRKIFEKRTPPARYTAPIMRRIYAEWLEYSAAERKAGCVPSMIAFGRLLDPSLNTLTPEQYKNHRSYYFLKELIRRNS